MDDNLTEIIMILDESGSMGSLTADTIGGFNTFIETQRKEPGKALVTLVKFNSVSTVVYSGVDLANVKPLDHTAYRPNGMTALYDAIGKACNKVGERLSNTPEEQRPSKVMVVIITDGEENSSREFNREKIKEIIDFQTNVYNWTFLFIGANIDAATVGGSMGISQTANYTADAAGTKSLYNTVSQVTASYRSTGTVSKDWNKTIR